MFKKLNKFWKSLGPGLITGASDNDTSGIATYSIAGARTGFSLLWMLIFLLPFMVAIQEMSARIGALSGCGLAGNIKRHYPKFILLFAASSIVIANILNIGADVAGMAAALNLIIPGTSVQALSLMVTGVVLLMILFLRYHQIITLFKWLAITLISYVIAFFMVRGDALDIIKNSLIPSIKWDSDFLLIIFAIMGTTISPYLYFWQASEEAEETKQIRPSIKICKFRSVSKNDVNKIEIDTKFGMFFSNFIAFFIVALTAATIFQNGPENIESIREIAEALRPLAGDYVYLLFTIGIVGSGLLAIPVLAGSAAYVLAEIFGWPGSIDKPFSKAREFYIVIIVSMLVGLIIPFTGFSPIKALFYTAILHALVSPVLILLIIHMASNHNIVGPYTSSPLVKFLGYATILLLITTGVLAVIPI